MYILYVCVCVCLDELCFSFLHMCDTAASLTLPLPPPLPPPLPAPFQTHSSTRMAADSGRVVAQEREEPAAPDAAAARAHCAHTRSQSHIQFQPLTHTASNATSNTTQWKAPRALAHTRSHSHTHFSAPSHTPAQKYGCRLTHSLSAMARGDKGDKGDKGAQGSAGKLILPTEPLFPKTPPQVRGPGACLPVVVVVVLR